MCIGETGIGEWVVPEVTESVSIGSDGVITITLNNLSARQTKSLEIQFSNRGYKVVEANIVTGDIYMTITLLMHRRT